MMYLCRPAMTQCVKHKARGPYLARPIGLSGSVSIILHFSCMSLSTVRSNWIIVWNQTPQLHMQRSLLSVTTLLTTALFYFPRILPERKWDYWRKKEKKHVGKKRKMYSVTLKCLLINDSNIEIYGLAERCRSRSFQSLLPRWRTFISFFRPLFFTVSPSISVTAIPRSCIPYLEMSPNTPPHQNPEDLNISSPYEDHFHPTWFQ